MGRRELEQSSWPLSKRLLKWSVINVPWRKGKTATHPVHDDRRGKSALMGQLTGTEPSRLHGKHLDYHLKQFAACGKPWRIKASHGTVWHIYLLRYTISPVIPKFYRDASTPAVP